LCAVISMHGGPYDGVTLKVHSDNESAVRQRLAVNDVSECWVFVSRSNPYGIARLPEALGKDASAAWTDIVGVRALFSVGVGIFGLGQAYHHDDGKPSFHSAAERVIQRHVAQTLTRQIRDSGDALIPMGNVHHDLREDDSNERSWFPGRYDGLSPVRASLKPRQLPRLSIWIAFVPAGNNRGKTLVPHRLNSAVTNGQEREFSVAGLCAFECARMRSRLLRAMRRSSLRDDAVGPLDQANKNGGAAEFCSPLV
jgi:hypothetical protein